MRDTSARLIRLALAACLVGPSGAIAGELQASTLEVGGTVRSYVVYEPARATQATNSPVVLDLHASGITPEAELAITGMAVAADRHGFLVVAPAAATAWPRGGYTWNVPAQAGEPDDIAFIEALLEQLETSYGIDRRRVFATGYSGGARLASALACRRPDLVRAVAAVGGLRYGDIAEEQCVDSEVSILAIHSRADPVNPYAVDSGNAPSYWDYGVEAAVEGWARHNGCGIPATSTAGNGVEGSVLSYEDCRGAANVVFYRLEASGHVWPGSRADFPDWVGSPEPALPATDIVLRFFLEPALTAASVARP